MNWFHWIAVLIMFWAVPAGAKIENFQKTPGRLTLVEHTLGHWEMKAATFDYEVKDARTQVFDIDRAAGEKKILNLHYVRRNIRP